MRQKLWNCWLLLIFPFILEGQSKNEYLEQNRQDLRSTDFEFPQRNFRILGFGACHGSAKTEEAEYILLEALLHKKAVKFYLPETDFAIAHYFNVYLQTGDTLLLKDLVYHYGARVPQEKSVATYNKWKKIKQLNDTLSPDDRITVVGIDCLVTYKYACRYLLELIGKPPVVEKPLQILSDMVKTDTTDFSPYYNSYSKKVLQDFIVSAKKEPELYQIAVQEKYIFDHLLHTIEVSFRNSWRDRERNIYANYQALAKHYGFYKKPQMIRMGFNHLKKSSEGRWVSFFARLLQNNIYSDKEVVTVLGYLAKSSVLWDLKYDKGGNYTGYTTRGGFGIGDCWKERFKGIRLLKSNKVSDLTLFRLNQNESPYLKGCTDLIEINMFLKKSNKKLLAGKTTCDFADYALLISGSPASKPIEELP